MIHVAAFYAGSCAAFLPKFAVYRNQVDERLACPHLNQPNVLPGALDLTAEHVAVKAGHARRILYAQDDVIEAEDVDQSG
jgi:hypothetical protein